MDSPNPPEYIAYLLRLWKARDEDEGWRASLERVGGGEKRGFTSLEALIVYLHHITEVKPDEEEHAPS